MATTLGLGDIAFTGFQSTDTDKISFVLLRDVTAGSVITVTDNAWTAAGALTSNEGNSVLTFGATFVAGTQLNYDATRTPGARWANGTASTNLSEATSSNFALNASGDNLFIYNGTTAPAAPTSQEWIAGFATNEFLTTGVSTTSLTYLPTALASSSSALSLGIANGASNENGAYTAGSFAGTAASVRSHVHTVTNWASFTSAGGQAIPPSSVFTVNSNTNTPPVIASNLGITVRTSSLGNVIAGTLLNSIDAEQSSQQLTYRVTALPAIGTLRINSTAVVANVTTFTQSDINAGRLSYDAPALVGNTSFAFSVSDGSLTTAGSFVLRVIPNVLLNELKVNPPGNEESGNRYQYIEIRGTPNLQLTSAFVIMLDGNGSNVGRANYVISLDGRSLGSNGLLMIKSPTSGHVPAPATTVVADSRFDTTVGGVLSKLSVTFYLGTTATGIIQGTDYDANNDGTLELLPSDFMILDSVGWTDGDAGDRVYGGVTLTQSGGTPDASTRLNRNDSVSTAAWYNGDLFDTGNDPSQLVYDATRRSANLPINPVVASLTPGDVNFVARPLISINTGLSVLLNSVGNQILGSNLTSIDLEYSSSSLVYRVTSLPTSGTLRLNGVSVVANTTVFTQVDIDEGRLTIDAGSAATGTGFSFSVSNGVVSNSGTFLLGYRSVARTNLRIANYNIASSGGTGAPRTGLSTILQAIGSEIVDGVSRPIDVLALQEVFSQAATTQLVAGMLNTAYGTTAYASGTLNGASTGNGTLGVVFNSLTVELLGETAIGTVSANGAPRQAMRYRFRPKGTNGNEDFYMYNSHLKSEDNSTDAQRRFEQIQTIRANADLLGSGVNVIYTGDFNVYRSSESGYQEFLSTGNGRAIDPINRPGNWNNNASFVDVHTQAPSANPPSGLVGGGLDDRFDFQLLTASFFDGVGLEYSSGSYRTFANNGTVGLNQSINSATNTALSGLSNRTTVLNLLTTVSDHLPVVADYYFGAAQANTSPTNINLTNSTIPESNATGSIVGILSSVDANVGDVHTYSLVSGAGSTDNSRFVINGNQLLVGALAALNGPNNYSLRIRSVDQNGLSFEKTLSVSVSNVAPDIAAGSTSVTGTVTSLLTNTGTWADVPVDTVVLNASLGTVVKNSNGTWIWSYIPPGVVTSQSVTITASDGTASRNVTFSFTANAANPTLIITSGSRAYDRNVYAASASITGSASPTPSISYEYYSDSSGTTVIPAPTNAGTYYVVAFTAANLNNNAARSTVTAFTINRAPLVASITSNNKPFDNTNIATIATQSLSGILGSDTVTLVGGTATFEDAGVGNNKTVTFQGYTLSVGAGDNYTVNAIATTLANITSTVFNRKVFYNASGYENNAGANTPAGVNAALDTSKVLIRSGATSQVTGFENVSNYSRGINGVVLDIAGLTASSLSASDFIFRVAPAGTRGNVIANPSAWPSIPSPLIPAIPTPSINVTAGTATTPGRVRLEWPDNVIQNTWLQIIVKANPSTTGLSSPQTFYMGHAMADVNGATGADAAYRVLSNDLTAVQQAITAGTVPVSDVRDVNKDRRILSSDYNFVQPRVSANILLRNIQIPAEGSANEGSAASGGGGGGGDFAPLIGTPVVTLPTSQLSGSVASIEGGLSSGRKEGTSLLPSYSVPFQNSWTVTSSSITSSSESSGDRSNGTLDGLFAGLAKEELGRFFS